MDKLDGAIISEEDGITMFDYWSCIKILVEEYDYDFEKAMTTMEEIERIADSREGLIFVK